MARSVTFNIDAGSGTTVDDVILSNLEKEIQIVSVKAVYVEATDTSGAASAHFTVGTTAGGTDIVASTASGSFQGGWIHDPGDSGGFTRGGWRRSVCKINRNCRNRSRSVLSSGSVPVCPIMDIDYFHDLHKGETVLLVGNGANLKLTPPEWFDYPSIGMNTIHLYAGWKPTYYTTVDTRVMREFGEAIIKQYADVPKFIPSPNLDKWQGENFYRFYHRPGPYWPDGQSKLWPSELMSDIGITFSNVMHVAMQLAYFMGFSTMLIIGMEHQHAKAQSHFWGCDHGMPAYSPNDNWFEGYKVLREGMAEQGVKIINISANTFVPEEILPRDDWQKWSKNYETQNA